MHVFLCVPDTNNLQRQGGHQDRDRISPPCDVPGALPAVNYEVNWSCAARGYACSTQKKTTTKNRTRAHKKQRQAASKTACGLQPRTSCPTRQSLQGTSIKQPRNRERRSLTFGVVERDTIISHTYQVRLNRPSSACRHGRIAGGLVVVAV